MLETEHLKAIFQAALAAVDAYQLMMRGIRLDGSRLTVAAGNERHEVDLDGFSRILVLGAGKASARMAMALEDILGARISGGLVSVKYGHGVPLKRIEVVERATPCPTPTGRKPHAVSPGSLKAPMSARWRSTSSRAAARRCCPHPRTG